MLLAALALAVAAAVPSYADQQRSAAELWQAYPLNPDASETALDVVPGDGAAMTPRQDTAVSYVGDESGNVDSRLLLQLAMVIGALYAAFLCVWFAATRGKLYGAPDVSADRRHRQHRFVARAARSSRADPDAVWTCAIGWRHGRIRSRFRAMMAPPDGRGQRIVAQSRSLPWPPSSGGSLPTAEVVSALESLVAALVAAGWEPVESAGSWSARRFVWRREGEPPARLRLTDDY